MRQKQRLIVSRVRKWFKMYYDHLDLIGQYQYADGEGTVHRVKLHYSDVILFERIRSLELDGKRFYMTNESISEQLKMSESTVKECIRRLSAIGLVRTFYERPYNGRVTGIRYLYTQTARLNQLMRIKELQRQGGISEGMVDLIFLEDQGLLS